jgi:hypothetical protein
MSQQLLKQEMTVSQILRTYGRQFIQIREQYSDGFNGRCAIGVIMSYYGWNGKHRSDAARKLQCALRALKSAGIDKEIVIQLNDSGATFGEIADYLDRYQGLANGGTEKLHNVQSTLIP